MIASQMTRNQARNLRRKLAKMRMPVLVASGKNPKKNRSDRRPRRVVWPREQIASLRYRSDGSIKE